MCVVHTPKITPPSQTAAGDQPLPILRNPILDGMLGNIASLRSGTAGFRIDLVNPLTIPVGGGLSGSRSTGSGSGGGGFGSVGASGGGSSVGGGGGGGSGGGSTLIGSTRSSK